MQSSDVASAAMDPFGFGAMAAAFGVSPAVFITIFAIVSIWTLAIKGYALWHAANADQKPWFIALLIVNTFGILEIAYLLFFRQKEEVEEESA